MRTGRYALYAAAAAVVSVIALIAGFALRDGNQSAASPSPSSTTPTLATATASAGTPSPTAPPSSGRYASVLGYSIETPAPWHKTSCSPVVTQSSELGGEGFVPNPQNLSPRQWAEQDRSGVAGQRIEDVTYADRPAARKVFPDTPLAKYYVANGGRMYVVEPDTRTPNTPPGGAVPDAATLQTMLRMIESFHFLTSAEQAAVRVALPTALPPRTPEQVADGVAAAMTAKNADALVAILLACVTTAGEQAGGSFVSREKYVDDLRAAFAAGLVVTVRPRPLDGDRASGNLTVASTWRDSRGTKERKLMLRQGENDRWEWQGTLERFQ